MSLLCRAALKGWAGLLLAVFVRLLPLVLAAHARGAAAADLDPAPPPARAGQLSFIAGSARMKVDAGAQWEVARLNMPVAAGMSFATDKGSRLELRIGSSAVRAAQGAQLTLTELDDTAAHLELERGAVAVRIRVLAPGERFSVGADRARIDLLAPGAYRVAFAPGEARLTVQVFDGQARLALGGLDRALAAMQMTVADTRTAALLEQTATSSRTPLDDFALNRDRHDERSQALRHLPAEMSGAESLDGYGAWRPEPGYGQVWYPDGLPPDWAPYRFGQWRLIAPWGWTWIDDAPWGFAPFHYGRWLFAGGRWGWAPGRAVTASGFMRPVFAPGLVGFYGGAGGAAWTSNQGAAALVGWYPLAPGEVYWPAYSHRLDYARALNASNVDDKSQLRTWPEAQAVGPPHRFARTAFAATAMPATAFMGMQDVATHQVPLSPASLATAPLVARRAPPAATARGGEPAEAAPVSSAAPGSDSPAPRRAAAARTEAAAERIASERTARAETRRARRAQADGPPRADRANRRHMKRPLR